MTKGSTKEKVNKASESKANENKSKKELRSGKITIIEDKNKDKTK